MLQELIFQAGHWDYHSETLLLILEPDRTWEKSRRKALHFNCSWRKMTSKFCSQLHHTEKYTFGYRIPISSGDYHAFITIIWLINQTTEKKCVGKDSSKALTAIVDAQFRLIGRHQWKVDVLGCVILEYNLNSEFYL